MKDICGIYRITNLINNKCYIGSSIHIHKRYKDHIRHSKAKRHDNTHFQSSFLKHGKNNFKLEVLAKCPKEYLLKLEQWFIDQFKPEYNQNLIAGKPPIAKKKPLSQIKIDRILELQKEGKSVTDTTKELKICREKVKETLLKYGLFVSGLLSEKEVKEIRYLVKFISALHICKHYNITRPVIDNIKNNKTYQEIQGITICDDILFKIKYEMPKPKRGSKQVYQYDKNGIFLRSWESARDFCKENNLQDKAFNNIQSVCKGKQLMAYGYLWRYHKEEILEGYTNVIKLNKNNRKKYNAWDGRKKQTILQYDKNMNLVKEWNTLNECCIITGFTKSMISNCCNGKIKHYKDSIWVKGNIYI